MKERYTEAEGKRNSSRERETTEEGRKDDRTKGKCETFESMVSAISLWHCFLQRHSVMQVIMNSLEQPVGCIAINEASLYREWPKLVS